MTSNTQATPETTPDDDLDDLLRHYVRRGRIGSGVKAPSLCGIIQVWPAQGGGGAPWAQPGIVCPECQRIYEALPRGPK